MRLKNLASLNVFSFSGYANILLNFYAFFLQIPIDDVINIPRKFFITIDELCEVDTIFLYIGYFLIIAAIAEYFIRKKHNKETDNSSSKTVLKKILYGFCILFFWIGVLLEAIFLFLYTALNILV